jgi:hypothetical protein
MRRADQYSTRSNYAPSAGGRPREHGDAGHTARSTNQTHRTLMTPAHGFII